MSISQDDIKAGQQVYSPLVLKIYNLYVLGFSNRFVWACPSKKLLDFYNQNISDHHLDVGVGTGYFLNHCKFPSQNPKLSLLDLNQNCLHYTQELLSRYSPEIYCADIFQPITCINEKYKTIGINFVLHCLSGDMTEKSAVIKNLSQLLGPGGVLFGSTILGKGVKHNFLGRYLLQIYNNKKIFGNLNDDKDALEKILKASFKHVDIQIIGRVALFRAVDPI
jgi:2-polyprenyl-3-methyl-5-hydroxy-6-metoxy-1,4-benzoquinol methylase